MELKYILVILSCTLNLVTSLHLSEPPSWRNLNPSANSTVESAPLTKLDEDSSTPKKILLPIPIGIIPSIPKPQLPNPTQLLGQLQSTLNSLIGTLNSTLGSLKNSTGGGSGGGGGIGIGKPFYRLEEADHLLANISEIIKTSSRADNEILTNFTQTVEQSVDGALRDLEKAVLQLKSASALNATDSSPPTKDVPASVIQENVESARSARSEYFPSVARQGPLTAVRNGTMEFMNEVRRVFTTVTQPVRDFIEEMRRRLPTPISNA